MNREERAKKAKEWLETLNTKYRSLVDDSIKSTTSYVGVQQNLDTFDYKWGNTEVIITECRGEDAVFRYNENGERLGILNFASYKNPGGGFLSGSLAQEESLCAVSSLYPVLLSQEKFYESHINNTNKGLYSNDYILSRRIPFFRGQMIYYATVLTMAAPNKSAYRGNVDYVLEERMKMAYLIPAANGVDNIILGAWGCGVFGNDIETVASNWDRLQRMYDGLYKRVIHPLLSERDCKVFKEVMYK